MILAINIAGVVLGSVLIGLGVGLTMGAWIMYIFGRGDKNRML